MNAYIDSSVVLRRILGEKNPLGGSRHLSKLIASEILKVECFRTLERMRTTLHWPESVIVERMGVLHRALRSIHFVKFSQPILSRACQAFPVTVKSLDAIHLSTAVVCLESGLKISEFMTHDDQLGKAATALGLTVKGLESA